MDNNEKDWQMYGDHEVLKKCLSDKKFPYVVALARAVNALSSAHSLMLNATGHTPDAERDRINSYLFVSAILYEVLKLIRSMSQTFSKDESFQSGLRPLLKDKAARAVERAHLNPARHGAVFHFDAKRFAGAIGKTTHIDCIFVSSRGKSRRHLHYSFADVVAAEILVGVGSGEKFNSTLVDVMKSTADLATKLIVEAEKFMGGHLRNWGFEKKQLDSPAPASPENRSQD